MMGGGRIPPNQPHPLLNGKLPDKILPGTRRLKNLRRCKTYKTTDFIIATSMKNINERHTKSVYGSECQKNSRL